MLNFSAVDELYKKQEVCFGLDRSLPVEVKRVKSVPYKKIEVWFFHVNYNI